MVDNTANRPGNGGGERRTPPIGSFQEFRRWCISRDLECLPARHETVAAYVRDTLPVVGRTQTIVALRAIRRTHLQREAEDPTDFVDVYNAVTQQTASQVDGAVADVQLALPNEGVATGDAEDESERDLLRACARIAKIISGQH
jgi:hypothetical protein